MEKQNPSKSGFLGILFDCCQVYQRVYLHHSKQFYLGRCPRCLRSVRFEVGKNGSKARFWRAR